MTKILVRTEYVVGGHYGNTDCGVFKWENKIRQIFGYEAAYSKEIIEFENWANGKCCVSKIEHHFRK